MNADCLDLVQGIAGVTSRMQWFSCVQKTVFQVALLQTVSYNLYTSSSVMAHDPGGFDIEAILYSTESYSLHFQQLLCSSNEESTGNNEKWV